MEECKPLFVDELDKSPIDSSDEGDDDSVDFDDVAKAHGYVPGSHIESMMGKAMCYPFSKPDTCNPS